MLHKILEYLVLEKAVNAIYDLFLKFTGLGQLYEVPVTDNNTGEEVVLIVWAKNPKQAEIRAVDKAVFLTRKGGFPGLYEAAKSLGVIQDQKYYKPKGVIHAATSPFAVWRDPVWKNGRKNVFNNAGHKSGTMLKVALSELKDVTDRNQEQDKEITPEQLKRYASNNIMSLAIWFGMLPVGGVFLFAGLTNTNDNSLINQPVVAGIVLLLIGCAGILKGIIDYRIIQKKIRESRNNGL